MKIDFTNEEIGILSAVVFDGLSNEEALRWFKGMDDENREKAEQSFFNLKSKVLAANFMAMAENIVNDEEVSFE